MNMPTFTKLFSDIVTSSLWSEDDKTRLLFVTMLAICDQHGEVYAALPGLARVANMDLPACEAAVAKLESPDPYSRTKEHEGRRIEKIDGGWRILNYRKHRMRGAGEDRKEYKREYMRGYMRDVRQSNSLTGSNEGLTSASLSVSSPEEGREVVQTAPPPATDASRPTLAEVKAYAIDPHCGFRPDRVEEWFHDQCATEWRYAANWRSALKRDSLKERWRKPAFTATRKGPNI